MVDILILEDDRLTRAILRTILRTVGYTLAEASDGQEGLEVVQAHQPRLVMADLHMPGVDGLTFAQRLRELPFIAVPHLIFMSASIPPHLADVGQRATLSKPFDMELLLAQIAELIPQPSGLPALRELSRGA
ncbi:MAG TPA: response regulator [Herpetosiphonaceae bacterium]|nr:response regulator [Herpetosiphonaceae bacterium]